MQYLCTVCGYIYDEETGDPESGVEPDTKWGRAYLDEIKKIIKRN